MKLDSLVPSINYWDDELLNIKDTRLDELIKLNDTSEYTILFRLYMYNKKVTVRGFENYVDRLVAMLDTSRSTLKYEIEDFFRLFRSVQDNTKTRRSAKIKKFGDKISKRFTNIDSDDFESIYEIIEKIENRLDIFNRDFPTIELVKARWYCVTGNYKIGL